MDAPTVPQGSVGFEPEIDAKGLRVVWLEAAVVDKRASFRAPCESVLERGVVQDVAPLLRMRRVSRSVVRQSRLFRSALNALKDWKFHRVPLRRRHAQSRVAS